MTALWQRWPCPTTPEGSPGALLTAYERSGRAAGSERDGSADACDLFAKTKPLAHLSDAAHDCIEQAVARAPEPDVVAADAEEWAGRLAASEQLDSPVALIEDAVYDDKGPIMVHCTGMSGVSFSPSEHRPYMRDGRRIEVRIPLAAGQGRWRRRGDQRVPPAAA